MKNIGFVGIGNMASQIINGLNKSDLQIKMYGENDGRVNAHVEDFTKRNVLTMVDDINSLVTKCDYIIFSVPAFLADEIISGIDKKLITDQKVFMSICAGVTLEQLGNSLNAQAKIVRIMPNVNAAVQQAMVALCANKNTTQDELNFAISLFDQVGKTIILKENVFDIFMAISGSFPAAVFMLIDSLANVGVEFGMNKKDATAIATQVIYGSAEYAKVNAVDTNTSARALMDIVCSPNGTTINGVERLEEFGFSSTIEKAVIAMMKPKREDK